MLINENELLSKLQLEKNSENVLEQQEATLMLRQQTLKIEELQREIQRERKFKD